MARITLDIPDKFLFRAEIEVRATDLNYGNHVGNDMILTYMQEARVKFYRSVGIENEMKLEGDVGHIIADVAVIYKSETFLGDVLLIDIAAQDISRSSFEMLYLITNKATGKEVARGKTGMVCFNYATRKVASIPPSFVSKLT